MKRQTELLEVNRSSIYRPASQESISESEHKLRGLIDRIHTDNPTWGYRTITSFLREEHGLKVNRKRVRRIMRDIGVYAIYPKPNLSRRYHAAHIRPYLLRHMDITEPDQVWGVDITYVHLPSSSHWPSSAILSRLLEGEMVEKQQGAQFRSSRGSGVVNI